MNIQFFVKQCMIPCVPKTVFVGSVVRLLKLKALMRSWILFLNLKLLERESRRAAPFDGLASC